HHARIDEANTNDALTSDDGGVIKSEPSMTEVVASGAARMGLASLMRPQGPLPPCRSRGVPLRRGPNETAAIIAAKMARWRHVLSFCGFAARLRDEESDSERRSPDQHCQPLSGCGNATDCFAERRADDGTAMLNFRAVLHPPLQG